MHSFTIPHFALRSRPRWPLFFSTLLLFTLLTGCQEDTRATKTNIVRASELADNRLHKATGNFLETFGQQHSSAEKLPSPNHTHELIWSAPLTREDGSSLSLGQIAGFRIYYRMRHKTDYDVIAIEDPSITHYSLEALPPGAYEFSITTVDASGMESQRSDPVMADLT